MRAVSRSVALLGVLTACSQDRLLASFEGDSSTAVTWARSYELDGAGYDGAYVVHQTNDGGYVLSGRDGLSAAPSDITAPRTDDSFVLMVNENGAVQWGRRFPASCADEKPGILSLTSDGGFILAATGFAKCTGTTSALRITKLSATGDIVWQRQHAGLADHVTHIDETADGGYVVTSSGGFIAKLDAQGSVAWTTGRSHSVVRVAYAKPLPDGSILAVGTGQVTYTSSYDVAVTKFAADGTVLWDRLYGDPAETVTEYGVHLHLTPNGFIVSANVVEQFTDGSYHFHAWIMRADASGEPLWQKRYTTSGDLDVQTSPYSLHTMSEGGFIFAGSLITSGQSPRASFLARLADNGSIVWQRRFDFNPADGDTESLKAIQMRADGGFVAVGGYGEGGGTKMLLYTLDDEGLLGNMAPMSPGLVVEDTTHVNDGAPQNPWIHSQDPIAPGTAAPIEPPVHYTAVAIVGLVP